MSDASPTVRTKRLFTPNAVIKAAPVVIPADVVDAINSAIALPDAPRVTFVVSADNPDLEEDVMTEAAQQKLARQLTGKLFFMNHDWDVPEDIFGEIEQATVVQRELPTLDGALRLAWCTEMVVRVATNNPRAMQLHKLITVDDMPVGASVTILVLESTRDKQSSLNLITDVYGLETSAVGVPAQQNAWVENGKSFQPDAIHTDKEVTAMGNAPTPATKGLWEQSMAEQQATSWETFYDYTSALRDGVEDLIELCEGGTVADPEAELKALVAGFANALYALVLPALAPVATTEAVSLSAARQLLGAKTKTGAALSKDNLANLESIHDSAHASETAAAGTAAKCYAMHKGLTCAKCKATADMDEAGAATGDEPPSESAKGVHTVYAEREALQRSVHSLTTENTDLKAKAAELTAANTDLVEDAQLAWTSLEIATAALQKFKNEPMPAA